MAGAALDSWWDVEGYAAAHGMGPIADLELTRFLSFMWYMMTKNAEEDSEVEKIRADIWRPPKGTEGQGPWSKDAESKSFNSLKAGLGI